MTIEKRKLPPMTFENTVFVGSGTEDSDQHIFRYVNEIAKLFQRSQDVVYVSGAGQAIKSVVDVAEISKRSISDVHDVYRGIGNFVGRRKRTISKLVIGLSNKNDYEEKSEIIENQK